LLGNGHDGCGGRSGETGWSQGWHRAPGRPYLLGLKGTMSEAELHLLKQRMLAGKQAKARRGELAIALPTGYVRRASGEAALDPDEQVQTVVRLIFSKFAELGTLHGVLRWLVDHDIELGIRLRSGPDKGELVWRRPNRMTLQNILHSPVYAGIYAYGRRRVDPRRQVAGRPSTGRVVRAPDQWLVMIPGVLPAYITVEAYHANQARLAANAARAETPGVVRAGSALLSGLARCGRCGRRMTVRYHLRGQTTKPEYVCARQQTDYGAGVRCQALAGAGVDAFVTEQVLAALAPAAVEVSLRAAEQVSAERAELERIWQQRLERAAVAADRARRCYRLAEPENRLVVRQLEADWEAALAAQQRLREEHDRFTRTRPHTLTPGEQQAITALAGDIQGLWAAATTTDADRKQLIRALVDQVTITVAGTSERVAIEITWAGGHTTCGQAVRPVARLAQLSCYPQLLQRVRQLAEQGHRATAIANRLHAEGFRPAKGRQRIGVSAITQLLHQLGYPRAYTRDRITPPPGEEPGPHEWWLDDLAAELAMPPITLHSWIRRGWVHARQESRRPYRWIIHADAHQLAELHQRRTRPPGWYTRRRWADSEPPAHNGSRDHAASSRI
jgi:Recombinase/Recombinase zinc beta ribbon domain